MVTSAACRKVVAFLREHCLFSERRACKIVGLCRSSCRYQAKLSDDSEIRICLRQLAEQRRKFGAPRLHVLLRREGYLINRKRTERLYREEGLSLRLKKSRKRSSCLRVMLDKPERVNQQHWSMDFVADSPYNGHRLRILTVVDDLRKECPVLEVNNSLTGQRVTRVLERIALTRDCPKSLPSTTGQNLSARRWMHGPMKTGSSCTLFSRESQHRMPLLRA